MSTEEAKTPNPESQWRRKEARYWEILGEATRLADVIKAIPNAQTEREAIEELNVRCREENLKKLQENNKALSAARSLALLQIHILGAKSVSEARKYQNEPKRLREIAARIRLEAAGYEAQAVKCEEILTKFFTTMHQVRELSRSQMEMRLESAAKLAMHEGALAVVYERARGWDEERAEAERRRVAILQEIKELEDLRDAASKHRRERRASKRSKGGIRERSTGTRNQKDAQSDAGTRELPVDPAARDAGRPCKNRERRSRG